MIVVRARRPATSPGPATTLAAGAPGRRVFGVAADVSSEADNARLFAFAEKEFGRLDVLVCNAGISGLRG